MTVRIEAPPHSLESEQAVLASMMIDREALHKGVEMLRASDFYRPAHSEIFDALVAQAMRDEPCDLVTTQEELRKRGKLDECGGMEYLMSLIEAVPTAANIEHYARIVVDKAILRQVIADCSEVTAAAYAEGADSADVLDMWCNRVLSAGDRHGTNIRRVQDISREVWTRLETYAQGRPKRGHSYGLSRLDALTRGACPGELTLIGGGPSEGKTILCNHVALNAAMAGTGVLYFSQEMPDVDIVERMLLSDARVDCNAAHEGRISDDEWVRLSHSAARLWELPIWINDLPATQTEIVAASKRAKLRHNIGLVVIDYLQLINYTGKADNRNREIGDIAKALKQLARSLNIPVVCATQLNRDRIKRQDKRPCLLDLRDSGEQEQHADKVILVHNPNRLNAELVGGIYQPVQALLIVAKHRGGPTGEVPVWFEGRFTRFSDCEARWTEPVSQPENRRDYRDWTKVYDND